MTARKPEKKPARGAARGPTEGPADGGRPILFATDFSRASESALDTAIEEARERNAELVIAHVYPRPAKSAADNLFAPGLSGEIDAEACDRVIQRLEPLVEKARKAGVSARALALEGSPEHAIVASAGEMGAILIVIGTHGRRGVQRLLLGSVAARVIASAPCPVLTIRPA